jgi:tetratricopeptide (TPR) repeat protein
MTARIAGARRPLGRARGLAALLLGAATALASSTALADTWSDAATRLETFEKEMPALAAVTAPDKASLSSKVGVSRLLEAQVAFGVGDYDKSSVLLYEIVAAGGATGVDVGLFYLAESLYQQGDLAASRTYFARVVDEAGAASKYYQAALERLVELAILLDEHDGVDARISALAQLSAAGGRPSAIYVRGKYAEHRGQHDDALALLAQVPAGSTYDFQAQYVAGAVHIAKGDLQKAIDTFEALSARTPTRAADRRVVELSFMALGRLHYERDLPAKAIDSYLMINRKSDLFADALYEVAWVYVKGKQFDKALRALELLALADPNSTKLPTVKILEGNLRIRKAQLLRARQIEGMVSPEGTPAEEYAKARAVFLETHDTYQAPYDVISAVLAGTPQGPGGAAAVAPAPLDPAPADGSAPADGNAPADGSAPAPLVPPGIVYEPADYLDQISGRNSKAFSVDAEMPSIGAAWLREDPEVARVVAVEGDLGDIQDSIEESEQTIDRLELSMSLANKVKLFPELGKKRARITEMQAALLALQVQVVDDEAAKAASADPRHHGPVHRAQARGGRGRQPAQRRAGVRRAGGQGARQLRHHGWHGVADPGRAR